MPSHSSALMLADLLCAYLRFTGRQADLMWHCDDSFRDPQPLGSLFFCVEAPLDGAETWFASGTAALAALSPARQQQLAGLAAVHDYNTLNEILRVSFRQRVFSRCISRSSTHVVQ